MIRKIIFLFLIVVFLGINVTPSFSGGWLRRIIGGTYDTVKRVGQEVIEKPARRMFKKKSVENKKVYETNYDYVEKKSDKAKNKELFESVDLKNLDMEKEYSLEAPYNGGTHGYNRNSRIDSIIGLVEFNYEEIEGNSKETLKKKIEKLSNLQINHLYYGLLTLQEESFFDSLSTLIASDIKYNQILSGGFVTYNVSTMNFRKMSKIFILNSKERLDWRKKVKFPEVAESFFLTLISDKPIDSLAKNNEIILAQGVSMDGWRVIYNSRSKNMKIAYFTPQGFMIKCGMRKISVDRMGN